MDINLTLERECPRCEGGGAIHQHGQRDVCPTCKGLGQCLTVEGQDIIALVRRWLAVEPRADIQRREWADATIRNPLVKD